MELWIAGQDRSEDLGRELADTAAARADRGLALLMEGEAEILGLGTSADTAGYLAEHIRLMRIRTGVEASQFAFRGSPGVVGRLMYGIRRFLWKILRYQHDWFTFHQNNVNAQLAYGLDFEHEQRSEAMRGLDERVKRLEASVAELSRQTGGTRDGTTAG